MAKKFDAKAKAKRQKIIAAVGGVILLAVLAYEVPSLMKTMNKKPPPPPVIAAPPPPGATVPPAGAPVAGTPISTPATGSAALTDSDPAAQAGSGQLVSFDRFPSKDPFVQQATAAAAPAAPAKPAALPPPPPPPATTPKRPAAKPTSARISVNGASEQVRVGETFPAADPVFTLVSLTNKTAKIAIAGGSLSTGNGTVTLTKGKKVTLMNTADGTRYELILVSLG
ncbi:MAG: hypothetical protein M3R26_04135 [Actinomycetota bacterium]|nr:hypothetical protein [Actinomycetota bacterium]